MNLERSTQTNNVSETNAFLSGGILQRKCNCGNQTIAGKKCTECLKKNNSLQRKLSIGASTDPLEREADQVADKVMAAPAHSTVSGSPPSIQRYAGLATRATDKVTTSVHQTLASPGRPLGQALQQEMGNRFGHDFSMVRVHTDATASESARSVNALAYTVGQHIVFQSQHYKPESNEGKRLLAHEMTHVVQQAGSTAPLMQRALVVENPSSNIPNSTTRENWEDVAQYMNEINSSFTVSSSGPITPTFDCLGPLNTSSQCLCDLHNSPDPDPWKIKIDDDVWPHTEEGNRRVTTQSTNSVFELGSWGGGASAGTRTTASHARVLAHELCGHAWLMEQGIHPSSPMIFTGGGDPMARPGHDPTIDIENQVAREMYGAGAQERGTFGVDDPHYGESLIRLRATGWDLNKSAINDLPGDQQARLRALRDVMLRDLVLKADVIGHADHTAGTGSAINAIVSLSRAHATRDWLIAEGIDAGRFRSVRGANNSECPAAPVNNPDCRGVDVYLFIFEAGSESFVNPVPQPTP